MSEQVEVQQHEQKTPIQFVLESHETYLTQVVLQEYKNLNGLTQHHLLILTNHLNFKPFVFPQKQNTPIIINAVMQTLTRMSSIMAYVLFADGYEIDKNYNPNKDALAKPQHVLRVNIYMKEGTLCKKYLLIRGNDYKIQLQPEKKDLWFEKEEKVDGFMNPFVKNETSEQIQDEIKVVVEQIQKSLKKFIQSNKNKKSSPQQADIQTKDE